MEQFLEHYKWVILIGVALWVLPWKGVALWKAAEMKSKTWFIIFLLINTLGILEIIFIFFFSRKTGEKKSGSVEEESSKLNISY